MDRQFNASIKEYIIGKIAEELEMSEMCVRDVINHEFELVQEKMMICDSIEFSGFGKFFFNRKKAERKLKKFEAIKSAYEEMLKGGSDISPAKRKSTEYKMEKLLDSIKLLKFKLHEN